MRGNFDGVNFLQPTAEISLSISRLTAAMLNHTSLSIRSILQFVFETQAFKLVFNY